MKAYLLVIFAGIIATSLYNYFSCLLRALGNSTIPLVFLAVSAVLNIGLDLLFVAVLPWGIRGAALATVIAQYVSGIGITLYVLLKCRDLLPSREDLQFNRQILGEIGKSVFYDLRPAVCHELWYPDGAGTGKQLRTGSLWPLLPPLSKLIRLHIFRCRISVMHILPLSHRITVQAKKIESAKEPRESFLISFLSVL